MGLSACFRRPSRQDYYRRHDDDDCYYSSPLTTLGSGPPSTLPPHPVPSYCFADWIKLRCLGGGNNSRKRKAAAGRDDRDGRERQPERVIRKIKKKQVRAAAASRCGGGGDNITLQEFPRGSPSRQPPLGAAAANNKVYPHNVDYTTGSFSLEMLLEIEEEAPQSAPVGDHDSIHVPNIDDDDDDKVGEGGAGSSGSGGCDEGNWRNSSSRKRRVSFRLPEEGDIFTYDPSDSDEEEEEEEHIMDRSILL